MPVEMLVKTDVLELKNLFSSLGQKVLDKIKVDKTQK